MLLSGITYPFFPPEKYVHSSGMLIFYLVFCIQNLFWNSLAVFVVWGYSCLPFFMAHSAFFCLLLFFLICLLRKIRLSFKIRQYQLLSNSFANVCFLYDHCIICPARGRAAGRQGHSLFALSLPGSQYRAGVPVECS